ncbi:hypothetical protein ES703_96214 [subsurface metagenome]
MDYDGHYTVGGFTGSGKSVFLMDLFDGCRSMVKIFFNSQLKHIKGVKVSNVDAMRRAFEDGKRRLVFNPASDIPTARAQLAGVIDVLFKMAKKMRHGETREIWCSLFVDEGQDYAPKGDIAAALIQVWRQGLEMGIQGVICTQRFAEISHTILTQSKYVFFFRFNEFEKDYLERLYPVDKFWLHIQQPYHFAMVNLGELSLFKPIKYKSKS